MTRHKHWVLFNVLAVATLLALLTIACSGTRSKPDKVGGDGVQLVTEAELLLHVAEATAQDIALVIAGLFTDTPHDYDFQSFGGAYAICDPGDAAPDREFADSKTITHNVLVDAEDSRYLHYCELDGDPNWHLVIHTTFGDSVYSDGTVAESNCHKLPSAGTVLTGEYRELTNDTPDPIDREITHTVEESNSSETSLSETVDLTNGVTVEAGASFPGGDAKATEHFESHLGIEHGSVAGHEDKRGEEVKDISTVRPGQIIGASFTLDDSARDCDITIDSVVDYADLSIRVWRHSCGPRCESKGTDQLIQHGVISGHGRDVTLNFDSVDDLVRLAKGTNPHCDGCAFALDWQGPPEALDRLDDAHTHRSIQLTGTRRYISKDSASVVFKDITGLDTDCVHDTLSKAGTAAADLDKELQDC